LTAGKADETVSDGGGARPGHSIFTSHVLDALEGAAAATEGVITANGVMAYVYERVGTDPQSYQTPHYGFLEGDGDFVFKPMLAPTESKAEDTSLLVQTPALADPTAPPVAPTTISDQLKRLIADPSDRIRLSDFVDAHLRRTVQAVGLDRFPVQGGSVTPDDFAGRLRSYEEELYDLEIAVILLARWASLEQLPIVERIFARIAETDKGQAGLVTWINLGWYPLLLLLYAGGIAALSQRRFDVLRRCLLAPVTYIRHGQRKTEPVVLPTIIASTETYNLFKSLPGLDRRYTPRSDYLFQALQPALEDQLFLGQSYEDLFDEFEVFLALVFAELRAGDPVGHVWGPPGRFAWKRHDADDSTALTRLLSRAESEGGSWGPLRAGLFGGSIDRFKAIVGPYRDLLANANWY
jgi:hypothetical protein